MSGLAGIGLLAAAVLLFPGRIGAAAPALGSDNAFSGTGSVSTGAGVSSSWGSATQVRPVSTKAPEHPIVGRFLLGLAALACFRCLIPKRSSASRETANRQPDGGSLSCLAQKSSSVTAMQTGRPAHAAATSFS